MSDHILKIIHGDQHNGFDEIIERLIEMRRNGDMTGIGIAVTKKNAGMYLRSCTQGGEFNLSLLGAMDVLRQDMNDFIRGEE